MTLAVMFKKLTLGFVVLGMLSTSVHAVEMIKDVRYGDRERNQLDVYLPDNVSNPPVVVFIHGGRWFRNDKSQIELYDRVNQLMKAGMALVSINYTYSTQATWPTQLNDLRAAFDFIRNNADQYGYDGSKVAVWGQSSGAHLALWSGFDQAQSSATQLKAIVSWYAPSDLYHIATDREQDDVTDRKGMDEEPTPESILVGATVTENKALADAASPLIFLQGMPEDASIPPTLLVHGTSDFVVSPLQSKRLYSVMEGRSGVTSVELRLVEGGRHGGDKFDAEVAPVIDFLKRAFAQ
ncbi:alpha/beta hydrolase [Marinomonas posidonica]|uniref:Lipase/esterase n=1 Tax=Marinomonas posidonica (strain CECT 7376 / NCIMB 14433 / IVIA-Po-181) TaxID=491952 RepID=F6CX25_MARPP|nr:alpha/beta hydrolase [Marinomonas posidonica]AEF53279.1 putative lipase/esterase [Marinomonas posidonica IVIA-Po-181]